MSSVPVMTSPTDAQIEAVAAILANNRGARRGAPAISNIMEMLRSSPRLQKLADEVLEDARAAILAYEQTKKEP